MAERNVRVARSRETRRRNRTDTPRRPLWFRVTAVTAGSVLLAGCQGGLNSLDLPGTAGHGLGAYTVTVDLPDVATLPQNSPVMVDDVTVGSVSGIDVVQRPDSTIYATVQLSLNGSVDLPANVAVKVGQTSLLGSQHIELASPVGAPAEGTLRDGAHIPLSRSGRYPTTEEVLSTLGVVVNKGNLGALQDITDEVYAAVAGRAGSFANLVPRLADLTSSLDRQTVDVIAAIDGLNRVAGILARGRDSLGRTLDSLPEALAVLNRNRAAITEAFGALRGFATVASRVLRETKSDFAADLTDLYPVVKALNDNVDDLIKDLEFLPTFPFHYKYLRNAVRGDYLNVFSTFDLTVRRTGESIFTTSKGLDPNMKHISEVVNPPDFLIGALSNLSGQAADPFKIPPGTATQHQAAP
jgi:phospholipid/cholesterol/gamma-HCH transport system substrate-binding protein